MKILVNSGDYREIVLLKTDNRELAHHLGCLEAIESGKDLGQLIRTSTHLRSHKKIHDDDLWSLTETIKKVMMYHGSEKRLDKLIRQQANGAPGRPKKEKLNMIYLSPEYGFALACAIKPKGLSVIDHTKRIVRFNLNDFNPEKEIYIYTVDISVVPKNRIVYIDELQTALNLDEIKPVRVTIHKAGEVSKYYKIQPLNNRDLRLIGNM